jgi:hypothetical protein
LQLTLPEVAPELPVGVVVAATVTAVGKFTGRGIMDPLPGGSPTLCVGTVVPTLGDALLKICT